MDISNSRSASTIPPRFGSHAEIWNSATGDSVTIRPIRPNDLPRERAFLQALSPHSRYQRVLSARRLLPGELERLTRLDCARERALIALVRRHHADVQVGVVRYVRDATDTSAEFAIVIADAWQGRGLGERLLRSLAVYAREAGVVQWTGITLAMNSPMLKLARKLGIEVRRDPLDATSMLLRVDLSHDFVSTNRATTLRGGKA
jgi:GNAT superfamily N-acetyltransferase